MNVAICFSGHVRDFLFCKDFIIKYLIEPLGKVDTYFSIWNTLEPSCRHSLKLPLVFSNMGGTMREKAINYYTNVIDQYKNLDVAVEIKRIFNPILLEIDDYHNEEGKYFSNEWYRIYRSNQLKNIYEQDKNFKYDLVIKSRLDLCPMEKIDLRNIILEKDIVNIPFGMDFQYVNIQFALGSSYAMDIYSNMYEFIPHSQNRDIYCIHGERTLAEYISRNQIRINRFNYKYFLHRTFGRDNFNLNGKDTESMFLTKEQLLEKCQ